MIKEHLIEVLTTYKTQSALPFAGNRVANLLSKTLPEELKRLGNLEFRYLVKGSAGKGNFAEIPWLSIFDKEITDSAEKGYYIVFLFDAQMQGVYLSLNQGWTQYEKAYGVKEGQQKIDENTFRLKSYIRSILDFSKIPINLHSTRKLGQGYELGHICGKYYSANSIPDDSEIINDIRNLIGVYRELKGLVGTDVLNIGGFLGELLDEADQTSGEKEVSEAITGLTEPDKLQLLKQKFQEAAKSGTPYIDYKGKRLKRNAWLAEYVKAKNGYKCQACSFTFEKEDGSKYVEAAHIKKLAVSKLDTEENLLALCPNHHKMLDKGKLEIRKPILDACKKA